MIVPRFTAEDVDAANDAWGANCGPVAAAAMLGMTLDEARAAFEARGFAERRVTNPTMMKGVIRDVLGRPVEGLPVPNGTLERWPYWAIVRVQWEGPWTLPGVPIRARYPYTHWIGAGWTPGGSGVFDVNLMWETGGWTSWGHWVGEVAPRLMTRIARCHRRFHYTHVFHFSPVVGRREKLDPWPAAPDLDRGDRASIDQSPHPAGTPTVRESTGLSGLSGRGEELGPSDRARTETQMRQNYRTSHRPIIDGLSARNGVGETGGEEEGAPPDAASPSRTKP